MKSVLMNKSLMLATVILMDLLAGMEFDLFVPSLPELQSQFHLSPFFVESLLSINFLAYCISLFLVGGLADNFDRKPIILFGITTFIIDERGNCQLFLSRIISKYWHNYFYFYHHGNTHTFYGY